MKTNSTAGWRRWLFGLTVAALAVSGLAQMPIFKRYYIADLPGMGWTADFYFTHKMHYVAAAVYLFLLAERVGAWLASGTGRLSAWQWTWVGLHGAMVATGLMRAAKNLDAWFWSPWTTRILDWGHLGLMFVMAVVALAGLLARRTGPVPDAEPATR
jgi:hypothetical protein